MKAGSARSSKIRLIYRRLGLLDCWLFARISDAEKTKHFEKTFART
jgi:hypothetical protein